MRPLISVIRVLLSTKFKFGKIKDLVMAENTMKRIKPDDYCYMIVINIGTVKRYEIDFIC